MIDLRANSIVYQAQIKLVQLLDFLVQKRRSNKLYDKEWDRADKILSYLEAWEERGKLDDPTQINNVLECLIDLSGINEFPVSPAVSQVSPPAVLYGLPGEPGEKGDKGDKGDAGLATDFQKTFSNSSTTVDSFAVSEGLAARWDYLVVKSTGESRAGSIIAVWNALGTLIQYYDGDSTEDIGGDTSGLEFSAQILGGNIILVAVVSSGTWTVSGSRYFIPNNGSGTGPISDALVNGYIYIGGPTNLATQQLVSGAITLSNTGVATLANNVVSNANVSSSAAIAISKLAATSPNRAIVSDGTNQLVVSATTSTEIGFLSGVTSSVQVQLNNKLTDPMTTAGDVIIRNAGNVTTRLGIGSAGQVLTVSGGAPVWQTPASGFADPMTTAGDIIIRNGSNVTVRLGAGSSGQVLTISGGVPVWSNPTGAISGLTASRVPFAASATSLTDSSKLTFSTSTTTLFVGDGITSGNVNTSAVISTISELELQGTNRVNSSSPFQAVGGIKTGAIGPGDFWFVKFMNIGDWNMDSSALTLVAHGIADYTKIREVSAVIISDDSANYYMLGSDAGGVCQWNNTNVILSRTAGGTFDGTSFDSTPFNRGYIKIVYIS